MLEKIEVGKNYLSHDGVLVTVFSRSENCLIYIEKITGKDFTIRIDVALDCWSEIPTPKKRYWLWDAKDDSGKIFKTSSYVDDNGYTSNGELYFDKEKLIKKHENEWVEV